MFEFLIKDLMKHAISVEKDSLLTDEQIDYIRRSKISDLRLARKFKVDVNQIRKYRINY